MTVLRIPFNEGVCEDCICREAVNLLGMPRVHPLYGFRMTAGCAGCGGKGTELKYHVINDNDQSMLTSKQRFVMECRYGWRGAAMLRAPTHKEIGEMMGTSRQAVAKLETNARKRLSKRLPSAY